MESQNGGKSLETTDDDNEDQIVSMVDVLQDEQQLQDDAAAVLGACDDSICTYPQGYMNRQALYACVTCTSDANEPAGVCLGCSLSCHDGHQLVELYTKRHFRCDCGNTKFHSGLKCKLYPDKTNINDENKYNQNFRGLYCVCSKPYPDPDDPVDDVMIQCIICEDWFHGRHLGVRQLPDESEYEEMVCEKCLQCRQFLRIYAENSQDMGVKVCTEDTDVDVVSTVDDSVQSTEQLACKREADSTIVCTQSDGKQQNDDVLCLLHQLTKDSKPVQSGAVFFKPSWRQHLCKCDTCHTLYRSLEVEYLMNEEDTIGFYEERGKQNSSSSVSQYQQSLSAFSSSLDRVQQVELLQGYSELKSELSDYLKKFAENGKVVREEDIAEFFEELRARKRQKTSVQYYCK